MGIWNCRRHLKIQYVIAIHLMKWLTNFMISSSNEQLEQDDWNTPNSSLIVIAGEFQNAIWMWGHFRRTICNKIIFLNLEKMPQKCMEMLQTAFGTSCMNRASVSEWHQRFEEGRESVRDDERYGRSKEINTPVGFVAEGQEQWAKLCCR